MGLSILLPSKFLTLVVTGQRPAYPILVLCAPKLFEKKYYFFGIGFKTRRVRFENQTINTHYGMRRFKNGMPIEKCKNRIYVKSIREYIAGS